MKIGAQIRAERRRRGLTGSELAEASSVSKSVLSRLERGERPAIHPAAQALLDALGLQIVIVPASWIISPQTLETNENHADQR